MRNSSCRNFLSFSFCTQEAKSFCNAFVLINSCKRQPFKFSKENVKRKNRKSLLITMRKFVIFSSSLWRTWCWWVGDWNVGIHISKALRLDQRALAMICPNDFELLLEFDWKERVVVKARIIWATQTCQFSNCIYSQGLSSSVNFWLIWKLVQYYSIVSKQIFDFLAEVWGTLVILTSSWP